MLDHSNRLRASGAWLLGCIVAAGCQAPPDVQPFADATQALQLAVSATADAVREDIAAVDPAVGADFDAAWEHRLRTMEALGDYSESLVAVVGAGQDGAQAARRVIGSVTTLLGTVSAAYPGGSAVTESFSKGAIALYARYAENRAALSVVGALRDADPPVQEVAVVLAEDFASMKEILRTLHDRERLDFLVAAKVEDPQVAYVEGLRQELAELRAGMAGDESLLPRFLELLDRIDAEVARPGYRAHEAGLAVIDERFHHRAEIVDQAVVLTRAWGKNHGRLAEAAASKRTPAFAVLVELSREMLEIYREGRTER